jgi:putative oxidoreductase
MTTATLPRPVAAAHPARTDIALLLLRVALAAMWLAHSLLLKVFVFTLPGFAAWLTAHHLPAALALPIVVVEIAGGVAILLGWRGARVSLLLTPILLGATWLHLRNGWVFFSPDGGWEYPLFLVAMSIVHGLLGDGALALKR